MIQQTILTSFGQLGDATSAITPMGRGYLHVQFRAGEGLSNPSVVNSVMSMTVALQANMPAIDANAWADVQTWSVLLTEILPGRDFAYINPENGIAYRLFVKLYGSGRCLVRLWGD
jgi:hypothetical protein